MTGKKTSRRKTSVIPVASGTVVWLMTEGTFETEILKRQACPMCFKEDTITALPPPLLKKQTDGTTHVCNPALGGCNHGFAKE